MTKRVVFICSQKGGAGKSTLARVLVECLRAEDRVCAAYDADDNVGQLLQYQGQRDTRGKLLIEQDPLHGCGYFDIRSEDDRDVLVNALALETPVIVFDLPGGVVHELAQVLDDGVQPTGLIDVYRHSGYAVTVVIVMTPVIASVRTVQHTQQTFGPDVDYVAVKNFAFGTPEAFVLFDGSDDAALALPVSQGKQALLEQGGAIIDLPELNRRTYALLDRYSLRFLDAVDDTRLPLADRQRVKQWVLQVREQLTPAQAVLGFAAQSVAGTK